MAPALYVKTVLSVPGVGELVHFAELHARSPRECTLVRLVEANAAGEPQRATEPGSVVPHPDTYGAYPGLAATAISTEDFEALWAQVSPGA